MKHIYHLIRFPAFAFSHECYDKHLYCKHIPLVQEMNITENITSAIMLYIKQG